MICVYDMKSISITFSHIKLFPQLVGAWRPVVSESSLIQEKHNELELSNFEPLTQWNSGKHSTSILYVHIEPKIYLMGGNKPIEVNNRWVTDRFL